jgi:hypothetical protein
MYFLFSIMHLFRRLSHNSMTIFVKSVGMSADFETAKDTLRIQFRVNNFCRIEVTWACVHCHIAVCSRRLFLRTLTGPGCFKLKMLLYRSRIYMAER